MLKRIICLATLLCMAVVMSIPAAANEGSSDAALIKQLQEDESYREYIQDKYNISEVSEENRVDPEELTDAIIEGMHSDKFSPFSGLEVIESSESLSGESELMPRTEHIIFDQDSTAYLATGNPGASGTMPWVGSCAVHPANAVNVNPVDPLIEFGTLLLYMNKTVMIGGQEYSSFIVNDTGDLDFCRSLYWTDLYFGDNTEANYQAAINYGLQTDVDVYFFTA